VVQDVNKVGEKCYARKKFYLHLELAPDKTEVQIRLSLSLSSRSNSGGYLRDYRPQWTPFFSPFPVVT